MGAPRRRRGHAAPGKLLLLSRRCAPGSVCALGRVIRADSCQSLLCTGLSRRSVRAGNRSWPRPCGASRSGRRCSRSGGRRVNRSRQRGRLGLPWIYAVNVLRRVELVLRAEDEQRLCLDRAQRRVQVAVEARRVADPAAPCHGPIVEIARILDVEVVVAPMVAPSAYRPRACRRTAPTSRGYRSKESAPRGRWLRIAWDSRRSCRRPIPAGLDDRYHQGAD